MFDDLINFPLFIFKLKFSDVNLMPPLCGVRDLENTTTYYTYLYKLCCAYFFPVLLWWALMHIEETSHLSAAPSASALPHCHVLLIIQAQITSILKSLVSLYHTLWRFYLILIFWFMRTKAGTCQFSAHEKVLLVFDESRGGVAWKRSLTHPEAGVILKNPPTYHPSSNINLHLFHCGWSCKRIPSCGPRREGLVCVHCHTALAAPSRAGPNSLRYLGQGSKKVEF